MDRLILILQNPDTYRAAIYLMTALGITLKPDQIAAIGSAGMALSGLLHAFTVAKDSGKPKP